MKVLVVEDERTGAAFLQRGLREEGFAVDIAERSSEADEAVAVFEYDVILLDVMIPGTDGFNLCKQWRAKGITTPILFLTARDDVADRVLGLNQGGDDYLTKPFAFEELLARIRALIRRTSSNSAGSILRVGGLEIDLSAHKVSQAGTSIVLTSREFQLLEYLVVNAGRLVTRSQLWEHVWESGSEPDSNVIDVYIRYLRDKLGRNPDYIRTQRGSGYVFAYTPETPKADD